MKNSEFYYSVGALLYCPANNKSIADSIINEKFGNKFSLALCLEDTINDNSVTEAEEILKDTISRIYVEHQNKDFFLPKIFIRVRNAEQINRLCKTLDKLSETIVGFILPKFSISNADIYMDTICKINSKREIPFYIMPILESPDIINLRNRIDILYTIKEKLDKIEKIVLNIRVGGNDLCHIFGFRRKSNETIYQIGAIANIFSDIVTVFGADYVISAPVWEYYNGENWKESLEREIKFDKLFGFTGKTVIHPNQIEILNNCYKVSKRDFEDALSILNWNTNSNSLVSGSISKERMNEYKTHYNWAEKTVLLSKVFGTF